MMANKRGQAALEFLMTYGWAILAAIVVIAILAYFGVFSPASYVPNQCILSASFGCNAGIANTSGITLELVNGRGQTVNLTNVNITGCGAVNVGTMMLDNDKLTVTVPCALAAGTKFSGSITLTYLVLDSSLPLTSAGKIVDFV